MSYTVPAAFEQFRENIELSGNHRETATKRKDRIVSLLKDNFEILEAFPSGSIPRYTAVKGYADLDVIVVLHYGKHIKNKKPSEVLQAVRDCLGDYRTNVRKNGQAVTLYYDTWPNVDIVPASRTVNGDGSVNHYDVPDMNTETWLEARPKKHSNRLNEKNEECGLEFKRIIKMIKWWNHQHSGLLQSFHIETMAIKTFSGTITDYPWYVYRYFDNAAILAGSPLWYETGFADAYLDSTTRNEVVKRLETAREKARLAWYLTYGENSDHKRAIEKWREIFGDKFPAYGA